MLLNVAGIVNDSIVDGPGLRLTVFLQGCDKDCAGCHNTQARSMGGGTPMSVDEIFAKIEANPLLSGVTFSGGEPLLQAEALVLLAKRIVDFGLSLAIYTGDTFEQIFARGDSAQFDLLQFADVLIDGPFIIERKSLSVPFRGSANQRILDPVASLSLGCAVAHTDEAWFP